LAALGAALALAAPARAGLVTYKFTGTVTQLTETPSGNGQIPSEIHLGSSVTGTLTFDTSAPQVPGNPGIYRSTALLLSATATIDGQFTYALTVPTTADEIDLLGTDFEYFKRGPATPTSFDPNVLVSLISFLAKTSSDDLSTATLSVDSSSNIQISNPLAQTGSYFIEATLTSLQPQAAAVPEPAAWALACAGVLALAGARLAPRRPAGPAAAA
jgi:hypothetical protein